ncbi:MAG: hypothetical protein Q8P68_04300 [Candidatus Peregrinibacteria bacterium]|nr:hypothetical protein [Candidatus Peregrinibacteria bacterium]
MNKTDNNKDMPKIMKYSAITYIGKNNIDIENGISLNIRNTIKIRKFNAKVISALEVEATTIKIRGKLTLDIKLDLLSSEASPIDVPSAKKFHKMIPRRRYI